MIQIYWFVLFIRKGKKKPQRRRGRKGNKVRVQQQIPVAYGIVPVDCCERGVVRHWW